MGQAGSRKDDRHGEVHLPLPRPGHPDARRRAGTGRRPLVDGGRPFGAGASVRDDGTEGTVGDLIGYTIIEADDLAAAKALTDGLPFLSNRNGKFAVEIFELLPM
jgi:hypothetical protein